MSRRLSRRLNKPWQNPETTETRAEEKASSQVWAPRNSREEKGLELSIVSPELRSMVSPELRNSREEKALELSMVSPKLQVRRTQNAVLARRQFDEQLT